MSDPEITLKGEVFEAASYAISKAALNIAVAKFSALYRKEGVLFMSICPGSVDTGNIKIGMELSL